MYSANSLHDDVDLQVKHKNVKKTLLQLQWLVKTKMFVRLSE